MTLNRIAQPYDFATFDTVFMIIEMMEMEMPRGEVSPLPPCSSDCV